MIVIAATVMVKPDYVSADVRALGALWRATDRQVLAVIRLDIVYADHGCFGIKQASKVATGEINHRLDLSLAI
jgi:hypothetical protein